jgi:uncharacterized membrane protein YphA (DoxX/SURF4 family)
VLLQRLFSTFADGWPGIGLLCQRFLTAIALIHYTVRLLGEAPQSLLIVPHMIGAVAGALLFVGFWTPLAGTVVAIAEIWIVFSQPGDRWFHVILAILGATIAMIGPGAWSIDARLFGRKHIQTSGHSKDTLIHR